MNTKWVMLSNAIFMAFIGIVCSFLPQEVLNYFGGETTGVAPLLLQVLGALYLGFALLNWMAKGLLIGGIYARPLSMANFMHFLVGALALLKGIQADNGVVLWGLAFFYALYAVLFGLILFRHPLKAAVQV